MATNVAVFGFCKWSIKPIESPPPSLIFCSYLRKDYRTLAGSKADPAKCLATQVMAKVPIDKGTGAAGAFAEVRSSKNKLAAAS